MTIENKRILRHRYSTIKCTKSMLKSMEIARNILIDLAWSIQIRDNNLLRQNTRFE